MKYKYSNLGEIDQRALRLSVLRRAADPGLVALMMLIIAIFAISLGAIPTFIFFLLCFLAFAAIAVFRVMVRLENTTIVQAMCVENKRSGLSKNNRRYIFVMSDDEKKSFELLTNQKYSFRVGITYWFAFSDRKGHGVYNIQTLNAFCAVSEDVRDVEEFDSESKDENIEVEQNTTTEENLDVNISDGNGLNDNTVDNTSVISDSNSDSDSSDFNADDSAES